MPGQATWKLFAESFETLRKPPLLFPHLYIIGHYNPSVNTFSWQIQVIAYGYIVWWNILNKKALLPGWLLKWFSILPLVIRHEATVQTPVQTPRSNRNMTQILANTFKENKICHEKKSVVRHRL